MSVARDLTRRVRIGDVEIGGGCPVAVQSMTNVPMCSGDGGILLDAQGNLGQIARLKEAGCEIVRVAIPNKRSLVPFAEVVAQSPLPVVADIHFNHEIAIGAICAGAAKIRINPGNIGTPAQVDEIIEAAGQAGVPIRIGVNAGSLDAQWRERLDLSLPERLAGSACEFVAHFEGRGFSNIVVSAKAHDVMTCVETYRLLSKEIPQVPLHVGITEAGTFLQGTVKSSVGLGILLSEGIGDTFRVSLTDKPEIEVDVAWEILSSLGLRRNRPELISCPTCSRCEVDMIPLAQEVALRLKDIHLPIKVAVMGCVVNGPGEARDADVGVACGKDNGMLFVQGRSVRKVAPDKIIDALFEEIDKL